MRESGSPEAQRRHFSASTSEGTENAFHYTGEFLACHQKRKARMCMAIASGYSPAIFESSAVYEFLYGDELTPIYALSTILDSAIISGTYPFVIIYIIRMICR